MLQKSAKPLHWEIERYRSSFNRVQQSGDVKLPLIQTKPFPFRLKEREDLAQVMKFEEILSTTVRLEDSELKRKSRWKAIHRLYDVVTKDPFRNISFENAIYSNATFVVNVDYFTSSIIKEYKFPNSMKMDEHLRYLYYSFDHQRANVVDWRDILLYYLILRHFRLVRDQPERLILELFVVFTAGNSLSPSVVNKDQLVLFPADDLLTKILVAPCLSDSDRVVLKELAYPLFEIIRDKHQNKIKRRDLEKLLEEKEQKNLLKMWSRHAWERLSSEMRLTVMDETLLHHRDNAEVIIGRYQLSQALALFTRNTYKAFFRAWKVQTIQASGARAYAIKKIKRKEKRLFQFWHRFAQGRALRRRRRILAVVIGSYATKARCFERIKLFIANNQKIERVVGTLHKKARLFRLAGSHLREFRRIQALRSFYHR